MECTNIVQQSDLLTGHFHNLIVRLRQHQHKTYFRETGEKYRNKEHEGKFADFGAGGLYSLQLQLNVPLQTFVLMSPIVLDRFSCTSFPVVRPRLVIITYYRRQVYGSVGAFVTSSELDNLHIIHGN
ncbi:hypothetical protein DAPPUDRAFT_235919 [Daphnia pulex]|uniref:Uncharacterized protein n=1 Tax=Daphnia pulex TaxID=6669 RepID=E9FZE6_DAPPU|nr:hypothetical protein DAPPUDRAFT_235919 [Daphnia pulex]|eukprot:EFX87039.1 hypothetical protein DAPPUDRAFT_235919 [Daphnia pulex]